MGVGDGVLVKVAVGVYVMVGVKVNVGVRLGVKVAVGVRVMVGVNVGVRDGVGVAVDGGPMYSTSMERKSTYPPDAVKDHERHPDGTTIAILTNPGSPEPVCKYHVSTEEQARSTALPTLESGVKPTMISKYETSRSKDPLATLPLPSRVTHSEQLEPQNVPPSSGGSDEPSRCVMYTYWAEPLQSM